MCAVRFQRFSVDSVYLTPLSILLFVEFVMHLHSCIKKTSTQFFEIVFRPIFRPYLPGLLATFQPVKREYFASFLPLHNW